MRDRRSVDDLTIEELEQVLAIKKRQARMERLKRYERTGRRLQDEISPDSQDDEAVRRKSLRYESFLVGSSKRSLRDNLLLGVELLAAVGLVTILIFAAGSLRDINRASVDSQEAELANLPTPEPTPLISAVVLPGGHTPPTDPGGARPNYDEVPAHLRPRVEQQFAGPVSIPTASPSHATRIEIPALDVDASIVQGDGWEQLKKGVGQHLGTANPGEAGNIVLSAHNDIYGELFRHLDQLETGDEIIIHTQTRKYTYRVAYWRVVEPTDISVMDPTREPIVTLISCYPYLVNTRRIVVVGELIG